MLTIEDIRKKAVEVTESTRDGCFNLSPPVKLRCVVNNYLDLIKEGEVVHCVSVDADGHYPGCVHLQEKVFWWEAQYFVLADE